MIETGNADDQTYVGIAGSILRFNNVPAGNQPLAPDLDKPKQIVIVVP
jgi:hypothetical protein